MSVLDELREAEQRVAQRLKELEPMVAEYRELEAVARRLGIDADRAQTQTATSAPTTSPASAPSSRRRARATAKPQPARRSATKRNPTTSRRAAAPAQRAEQLLELVRDRPGITVADAGKALNIDPTGLYRVVRRLEERGEVRKKGRNLEPVAASS